MADDPFSFLNSLSANRGRLGDTSYLTPSFASNLASAMKEAQAQGLNVGLASGYRTPETIRKSTFDRSGRSLHSYGLAADISGIGGPNSPEARQWAAIAARHNLYNPYGISDKHEFNHWQAIPNELTMADVPRFQAQFHPGGSTEVASSSASPPPMAYAPPGTTLTSTNPFIHALGNAESNWRNIPSTVDKDYPGQPGSKSQGFLQIDTPTWQTFAPKAGINAPNAMAASMEDQIKVAGPIPISRWGPRTLDKLQQQFGPFDKNATVSELAQRFGGGSTGMPATGPGSVATSDPWAATGTSPTGSQIYSPAPTVPTGPSNATAAAGTLPGFSSKGSSDDFMSGLKKMTGQDSQEQSQQPQTPQPMQMPNLARNTPPMLGYGNPQLAQAAIAAMKAGKPLPIGGAPASPGIPGTSLMSLPAFQALAMQNAPEMLYGYPWTTQGDGYV